MTDLLSSAWFYWAVGIAIGLPLALIALTVATQPASPG